jgi:hypothetical protein
LEEPVSTLVMLTIHVLSMQSASTPIMELTAVVLRDIKATDLLDVHQWQDHFQFAITMKIVHPTNFVID